jgi:predicted P-loop ATPase
MNKKSVLLALWQKFTSHFCKSEKKDELMAYISEFSTAPIETKESKEKDAPSKTKNLTENVESFLKSHYDFRYNVLTEETEFRSLERMSEGFQSVNQRVLNTLCLEAHEAGIACWDRDLSRCIYSTRIVDYHPFRLYLDELPKWDGVDRVLALARRVSENPLWEKEFRIWMLGMTAQWMGIMGDHANSVAPLLISTEQGYLKSTFCKSLLPSVLQRYYMDKVDLTSQGNVERRLAEMGLLNLDEFDKYSPAKMPLLKNLMQMASLSLCKAYQKNYRSLPRIASFIGTSNRKDLLTDPTGSRRFICVVVEHPIDCKAIEYEQLYAQLKEEVLSGERYWFTKEEEQELQRNNLSFYRQGPVEDVLRSCYRSVEKGEECELLSAADIFQCLKKKNPAAMRGANPASLAQILVTVGIERKHTKFGNVYRVIAV